VCSSGFITGKDGSAQAILTSLQLARQLRSGVLEGRRRAPYPTVMLLALLPPGLARRHLLLAPMAGGLLRRLLPRQGVYCLLLGRHQSAHMRAMDLPADQRSQ